jgi:hypothetical protein
MEIIYIICMQTKVCNKCGEEKGIEEFRAQGCICKICRSEYNKEWRENNKEHIKEHHKEWRENNKEHIKQYYENNKEHKKEYIKEWCENNKEHCKERNKEWCENNIISINGQLISKNTVTPELKPVIEALILLRKKKKLLKEIKENG